METNEPKFWETTGFWIIVAIIAIAVIQLCTHSTRWSFYIQLVEPDLPGYLTNTNKDLIKHHPKFPEIYLTSLCLKVESQA